jgi:hypothetical protein
MQVMRPEFTELWTGMLQGQDGKWTSMSALMSGCDVHRNFENFPMQLIT